MAPIASSQRAGLPMRIALATVSGDSTGAPCTSGAAPAACQPSMRGREPASVKPVQYAVMLPALPTGMESASISPSSSTISKAAVFCPSRRNGLTEFTSAIGCRSTSDAHELQRLVEVPAQRDHPRAVHERLGELARGDLALGHDHRARQPRARRVGRRARRRVARGGADDRLGALAHRGRHRAGHAAVLERAGGVRALELQPHLGADALGDPLGEQQRRRALQQRDHRVLGRERQPLAEALDEADPVHVNSSSMTRIARGGERMKPSCPISRTAA